MSASHRSYRIQDAASLVTALVLRRRETLLRRRARVLVRDRAAPLNLTDPRPFDRALREHMQTIISRGACSFCSG